MGMYKSHIHLIKSLKGKEFEKIFNDSNTFFSLDDFFIDMSRSFRTKKKPKCFCSFTFSTIVPSENSDGWSGLFSHRKTIVM